MSTKATRHHLAEVIAGKTLHTKDSQVLAHEIAAYLLIEGRTHELEPLLRDVMQYRQDHGVLEAVAVSAHELNDTVRDDIKSLLGKSYPEAKTVIVDEKQDPSVIGGLQINLANEQLDLSIEAKLSTFKRLVEGVKE